MIRAAIIGLGWWGQTTASSLANSDIIKPVLGIDPLEAMRAKGAALGLETSARFEDALTRSDIGAVILCTPQPRQAFMSFARSRCAQRQAMPSARSRRSRPQRFSSASVTNAVLNLP